MKREELRGIVLSYWEQGMEGTAAPAFQEERYIERNIAQGYCRKCGKAMGKNPVKILMHMVNSRGVVSSECAADAHEEYVGDRFGNKGLRFLKVGDCLTIFSKKNPSRKLWSGVIELSVPNAPPRYPDIRECIPRDISRKRWLKWFREEYPATLILHLGPHKQ
jgi:hypothetical protein